MYRLTQKAKDQIRMYDQAEILGEHGRCFLTGKETEEFHVWRINAPEGEIYRRVYVKNCPFQPYRAIIKKIEQKLLNESK